MSQSEFDIRGIKVQVGDFTFSLGELAGLEWELTEGDGNSCTVEVWDWDREVLDSFVELFDAPLKPWVNPLEPVETEKMRVRGRLSGNAAKVAQILATDGWTAEGIAIVLGNLEQESNITPGLEEFSGGGGRGILQWTGPRRNTYEAAVNPKTLENEMAFLLQEMQSSYPQQYAALKGAQQIGPAERQRAFEWIGWGIEGDRWDFAERYLSQLVAQPTAPKPPDKAEPDENAKSTGPTIDLLIPGVKQLQFLLVGVSHSCSTGVTTLEGQGHQWLLARQRITRYAEGVSIEGFYTEVARELGVEVEFDEESEEREVVALNAETLLGALQQIAKAKGKQLKVDPNNGKVTVGDRLETDSSSVELELVLGENLDELTVEHRADSSYADPTTRNPKEPALLRPSYVDALSGEFVEVRETRGETPTTTLTPPLEAPTPQAEQEGRIRGITLTAVAQDPRLLLATPDDVVAISRAGMFLDRLWVLQRIGHSIRPQKGLSTTIAAYTPTKAPIKPVETPSTQSAVPYNGGFLNPMEGGRLTFCSPRVEFGHARGRLHAGVDLYSPVNNNILASAPGTVVIAQNDGSGYGIWIEIDHGGGWTTRYAHMSSMGVGVGTRVAAGQVIGQMGSTGDSSGPHLHFEIRQNGSPIDPEQELGQLPCGLGTER